MTTSIEMAGVVLPRVRRAGIQPVRSAADVWYTVPCRSRLWYHGVISTGDEPTWIDGVMLCLTVWLWMRASWSAMVWVGGQAVDMRLCPLGCYSDD